MAHVKLMCTPKNNSIRITWFYWCKKLPRTVTAIRVKAAIYVYFCNTIPSVHKTYNKQQNNYRTLVRRRDIISYVFRSVFLLFGETTGEIIKINKKLALSNATICVRFPVWWGSARAKQSVKVKKKIEPLSRTAKPCTHSSIHVIIYLTVLAQLWNQSEEGFFFPFLIFISFCRKTLVLRLQRRQSGARDKSWNHFPTRTTNFSGPGRFARAGPKTNVSPNTCNDSRVFLVYADRFGRSASIPERDEHRSRHHQRGGCDPTAGQQHDVGHGDGRRPDDDGRGQHRGERGRRFVRGPAGGPTGGRPSARQAARTQLPRFAQAVQLRAPVRHQGRWCSYM